MEMTFYSLLSSTFYGGVKINEVVWDGKDDRGRAVSSGVYFAKLSVGNNAVTTKLVLIK